MTDAMAVARDMARHLVRLILRDHVGRDSGCEDCAIRVAAALREREQAVWREAAEMFSELPFLSAQDAKVAKMFWQELKRRATPPPRAGREGATP